MPLTKELLKRYAYNDVFVETGTWTGDGVEKACQVGFREIHSIEVQESVYRSACKKFKNFNNIILYLGDSGEILANVIKDINKRITFWLDAHDANLKKEVKYNKTPLLFELEAISRHPIKNHTIIIDDIDDFEQYGTSIEFVTEFLKLINLQYCIEKYQTKRKILIAEGK